MNRKIALVIPMLTLAPACGSDGGGGGNTDAVDESGTGEAESSSGGAEELHGFIELEFMRGNTETTTFFSDTEQIVVTLDYLDCLTGFYEANLDWSPAGVEGSPVFDEWADALCEPGGDSAAECTVVSITQQLDISSHLSVLYETTGDVEGKRLRFGPLPTTELAGCEPTVRVGSNGAIRGQTSSGDIVWETKSFNPDHAQTGDADPIQVRAGLP